jgi:hypothetical protein
MRHSPVACAIAITRGRRRR